jgi:hypothetical protein
MRKTQGPTRAGHLTVLLQRESSEYPKGEVGVPSYEQQKVAQRVKFVYMCQATGQAGPRDLI